MRRLTRKRNPLSRMAITGKESRGDMEPVWTAKDFERTRALLAQQPERAAMPPSDTPMRRPSAALAAERSVDQTTCLRRESPARDLQQTEDLARFFWRGLRVRTTARKCIVGTVEMSFRDILGSQVTITSSPGTLSVGLGRDRAEPMSRSTARWLLPLVLFQLPGFTRDERAVQSTIRNAVRERAR